MNEKQCRSEKTEEQLLIEDIYSILYDFIYSMAIYRTIDQRGSDVYSLRVLQEHFWYAISDNCLQQAVGDWCKVFASCQDRTYYTKIHINAIQAFEEKVKEKGIDLIDYSNAMKNFRDTFISHRDRIERRKPIPNLDSALEICGLYEDIVICSETEVIKFGLKQFYLDSCRKIVEYMDSLGVIHI